MIVFTELIIFSQLLLLALALGLLTVRQEEKLGRELMVVVGIPCKAVRKIQWLGQVGALFLQWERFMYIAALTPIQATLLRLNLRRRVGLTRRHLVTHKWQLKYGNKSSSFTEPFYWSN
jgi:hypothetical protein